LFKEATFVTASQNQKSLQNDMNDVA